MSRLSGNEDEMNDRQHATTIELSSNSYRSSVYDRYNINASSTSSRGRTFRGVHVSDVGGSRGPTNDDHESARASQRNRRLLFIVAVFVSLFVWVNFPMATYSTTLSDSSRGSSDSSASSKTYSNDGVSSKTSSGVNDNKQQLSIQDEGKLNSNNDNIKKGKRWNPCTTKYELERHDYEPRHGDVCRVKGGLMGLYECPSGCHKTGGDPPYCSNDGTGVGGGSGPCRVRDPNAPPEYRCDDGGVCILAVGTPKEQFKGVGVYYDDKCDNKCGDGRLGNTASWEAKGMKCQSDWDCSLAGVCNVQGVCECDPWADGVDCSYLKFQPVDRNRLGYIHEQHTSWGGSIVQSADGTYHMYLSEILCKVDPDVRKRCGLGAWQTHSRVVVARAQNVEGPYQRNDSDVVLHPEHHNPSIHAAPITGHWHLFSISGPSGPIERMISTNEGKTWSVPITISPGQNPGPLLRPDGSTYLFYRADGMDLPSPTCSNEGISVQVCPVESGPCEPSNDLPIFGHTGEDPSVFVDHRGNYHMLFNALPYKCVPKYQQGGHAWSDDGITWSAPRVGAFDTTIRFTDGTRIICERRERPQMVMGKDAKPLALVSALTGCPKGLGGVGGYEEGGAHHYRGGDDSFTLVQRMNL